MVKEIFLGIDVSKGYADFIPLDDKGESIEKSFQLTDNNAGHKQLTTLIKQWLDDGAKSIYCGVESTGGYENNWYYLLKGLQSQRKSFCKSFKPKSSQINRRC